MTSRYATMVVLAFVLTVPMAQGIDMDRTLADHEVQVQTEVDSEGFTTQTAPSPAPVPAEPERAVGEADRLRIDYIRSLYMEILGREPDPHGLETWLNGLKNGTHTWSSVREAILRSNEKQIGDWYRELLGRDPDPHGMETWMNAIRAGTHTMASVRQAIIDSEEYRARHGNPPAAEPSPVQAPTNGSLAQRVVNAAQDLVNRYRTSGSFPYDPLTEGGLLGCAQVATTALKNAGVPVSIELAVLRVIPQLRAAGWKEVVVPPYKAGDVVTWSTYDTSGDGRNDPDTHIGIVMQSGNSVQAMSNDSIARRPSIHSVTAFPVTRVLRAV
ncbi:MAG: hypothetical protein OZSIB_2582 [Candidatus Ozemobacter sibiricus]|jgi:hypothetical protein|uniref:DUF4214 domain-containing protein n=1 Tax=Candidatus Ozemobacter sibiricus TaxID=2268124 RepID=A0A367ZI86_9BACT|nr:MAG: hypothetical protein OZSIB_2582 [Candidatus Ozemobacter sibiricus]